MKKESKNRRTLIVFIIFCLGMGLLMVKKISDQQESKQQLKETRGEQKTASVVAEEPLVQIQKCEFTQFEDTIRGVTGKIDVARARLSFEVSGVVGEIKADKGQFVKKGQIMALLDKKDLELKMRYKENSLEGARIELAKSEKILAENKNKAETGYLLESKIGDYQLDVQLKQNKVQAAELEIQSAKDNLQKADLRAPFDGVVMERKIEMGETVSNTQEAFILLDIQHVYADIEVNEKKLAKIDAGQKISLKTNIHKETISGSIESIVPAVQGKAMVLSARAKLEPAKVSLLPGMFVVGEITVFEAKDVMVLPLDALAKSEDETTVFVYNPDKKTVHKRAVTPGYISRDKAVITKGLKSADQVVVRTTAPLQDGAVVRVES